MYYYAATNSQGFANTWDVYAFDSRKNRDAYVTATEDWDAECIAIRKTEIRKYVPAPRPFTGEARVIQQWPCYDNWPRCYDDIDEDDNPFRMIGYVRVGYSDDPENIRVH